MPRQFWPVATAALALTLAFLVGRVQATGAPVQTPLTYGGVVADLNGKPYTTAVDVTVAFYDAAVAGTLKCKAPTVQSEPNSGRFSVILPAECANAVHDKTDLWSEVAVGPAKTLLPRTHVGAVPYALESEGAKVAKGVQCVGCVNVGALLFDKDVDLAGHALAASKVTVAGADLTGASVKTLTQGGNADALHTHAALGGGGGGQVMKFKGLTSVTMDGGKGLAAMHGACAQQFGAARMCTTEVIADIYPLPTPSAAGWVLVDGAWPLYNPNFGAQMVVLGMGQVMFNSANCSGGYTSGYSGYNGHTLTPTGAYASSPCNAVQPIACCGP